MEENLPDMKEARLKGSVFEIPGEVLVPWIKKKILN